MEEMKVKRPRGRPKKPTAEEISKKIAQEEEMALKSQGQPLELPNDVKIDVVDPVKIPTLSDSRYDPFSKHKTEPKKFHYRALNTRGHMLRKREAQGYQVVPGAPEFGDLILGRIPKEIKDARDKDKADKASKMSRSVSERFEEEAKRSGIKTFKE